MKANSLQLRRRWFSRPITRIAMAISLLVLIVGGWQLWQARINSLDETWHRVQLSGVLRVGLDASYPPFEFVDGDTGEIRGYDADLANLIGEQIGVEVDLVNSGFDGLYPALRAGRFDCVISAFPYDPFLTRDVSFSMAYFQAGLALVTRLDGVDINDIEELRDSSLAVEWGSGGDVKGRELRKRLGSLILLPYATPDEALEAVQRGKADATLVDAISAYQAVRSDPSLRITQEKITDESYVIVVPPGSPQLLEAINETLSHCHADSTLLKLQEKWF